MWVVKCEISFLTFGVSSEDSWQAAVENTVNCGVSNTSHLVRPHARVFLQNLLQNCWHLQLLYGRKKEVESSARTDHKLKFALATWSSAHLGSIFDSWMDRRRPRNSIQTMGFVNTPRRPHLTRFVVLVSTFILAYLAFHSGTWAFTRFVSLPPYFRFLLLVDLGIWCWATNVHVLVASGIDVYMLLDAQHRLGNENIRNENHAAIYGLAVTFTIITIVSMQIFMRLAEKWGEEAAEIVPTITFLVLTSIVLWPRKNFFGRERGGFLRWVPWAGR